MKKIFSWIVNFFEAGQSWHPQRSRLPGSLQDVKFDAGKANREEIMRKARYFRDNNAIARRLGTVHCDFTTGANGIQFTAASSDEEWNDLAQTYWEKTASVIDVGSRQTFGSVQQLVAWLDFFDGDVFIIKTRGQDSSGRYWPRIQLIEAHLCSTPPDKADQEGKTIVDGVGIDPNGRPNGYYFKQSSKSTSFRFVSADSVIPVMEFDRAGAVRGVSSLAAAINYLHRLDDLQELEFRAANTQADSATFITNAAGQLDVSKLASRLGVQAKTTSAAATTQQTVEYYKELYGGRIFAGKPGDTFQHTTPTRPSEATRALWSYLTSCVCAACGIPKMVAFSEWLDGAQGTVVRGDYDIAAQNFKARSGVYAAAFREIYLYVISWGIRVGDLPTPPDDWFECTWNPPRAVNVDVGRNAAAVQADLKLGLTSHEIIYSQLGMDARAEITRQIKFLAFVKKTCDEVSAEEGVEVEASEVLGEISPPEPPDPVEPATPPAPEASIQDIVQQIDTTRLELAKNRQLDFVRDEHGAVTSIVERRKSP
jgi:capsid protein